MRWLGAVIVFAANGCGAGDACDAGTGGTICPQAGTGEAAFDGDGKDAHITSFYLPSQVRRGPDGLLYVVDYNNHRLRRIEADDTVTTVAGDGFHAGATLGIPATESSLENPIDFDFLPDGRIVFVSSHDPRLLVVERDGTLGVLAGKVTQGVQGNEGDNGPAIDALFVQLSGIAVAPDGAIYVSDELANRVRVIRDGVIATFAGLPFGGNRGDGGPATEAALNGPTAIAFDGNGAVFITDAMNCTIRKVVADGTITTVAGTARPGYSGDGGPAALADLAHPDGIAVAPDGTIFIGDRFNARIRRVAPDGTITTIAGTGAHGLTGDGGPARTATLGYPSRVQLDIDGGLLIADQTNHAIRKILPPL
jgi:hypothetical protein